MSNRSPTQWLIYSTIFVGFYWNVPTLAEPPHATSSQTALDRRLKPPEVSTEEINKVFSDQEVVQRRAYTKKNKVLFNPFFSFDFSDGPVTFYCLNLDLGYAFSETWELYLNAVPVFLSSERDIVRRVGSLRLADGTQASIHYVKPQYQAMLEVLWAPAYGKDSWGPFSIIRSDTFLKLGAGTVFYEQGTSGTRANLSLGKTFFFTNLFNLRFSAGAGMVESFIDEKKKTFLMSILELGLISYF